jgi:hypothetical protein
MSHRLLTLLAMLAAAILLAQVATVPLAGQARSSSAGSAATWTPSKTPWGDPDLQGIYTSDDLMDIPFERPTELGDRLYFTEEELAKREAQIANRAKADLQEFISASARVTTGPPGNWGERPRRSARQTSLIVDPPNGRMPPLTPEGRKRQAESAARQTAFSPHSPPASWEDYDLYIRCITRGLAGSIFPSMYDNGTQIVQAPGYVTLVHEKVHEARVIPLDKQPHVGQNVRSYLGDSRGHWEGNTLVVETTNFLDNRTGIGRNGNGIPTSDALRLVERFTRVDPKTINYELTVDDPKIFARSWKVAFPITQEPGYQLFEYTCHETNYAMFNSLSGARAEEKAAAEAAQHK